MIFLYSGHYISLSNYLKKGSEIKMQFIRDKYSVQL